MTSTVASILLLRLIQGHEYRQGPRPVIKGKLHQDGKNDPLVPSTPGGTCVRGAHRVAVPRFAKDLATRMFPAKVSSPMSDTEPLETQCVRIKLARAWLTPHNVQHRWEKRR